MECARDIPTHHNTEASPTPYLDTRLKCLSIASIDSEDSDQGPAMMTVGSSISCFATFDSGETDSTDSSSMGVSSAVSTDSVALSLSGRSHKSFRAGKGTGKLGSYIGNKTSRLNITTHMSADLAPVVEAAQRGTVFMKAGKDNKKAQVGMLFQFVNLSPVQTVPMLRPSPEFSVAENFS